MTRLLDVHLLGSFLLTWDGQPVTGLAPARLQHLVAYLLLHRHAPVARRQIAFALWPDSREEQALSNLRTALYRVQHVLPDCAHCLVLDRHTVAWVNGTGMQLDVATVEQALDRASRAREPVARAVALQAAVDAYTDDLLPDCYDEWIMQPRERLRQAFIGALEQLIELLQQQCQYSAAIKYTQRLLRVEPLHEPGHRELMRLHMTNGDQARALSTYHRYAALLRRELGVDPCPATQALYQRLLQSEREDPRAPGVQIAPPPPPHISGCARPAASPAWVEPGDLVSHGPFCLAGRLAEWPGADRGAQPGRSRPLLRQRGSGACAIRPNTSAFIVRLHQVPGDQVSREKSHETILKRWAW